MLFLVLHRVQHDGPVRVWFNLGWVDDKLIWNSANGEEIATGLGHGPGTLFADRNGDGKADYIHLASNGAATLYINQGRKADGGWGWWEWGVIATGVGSPREDIRLVDFNGDGRADYTVVDPETGALDVWYNRGTVSGQWGEVAPITWWNPGEPIASGVSYLPKWTLSSMVAFGDLNADRRAEYLLVGGNDSSVYAFLNGC
ncbi:hypothetical protein GGR57DRAFT_301111 [Xylariaceae sp. FL1272]|nr:hypothetical protein GGR57DRAFT_301111 [Xylariaceae sp. FL1272]